MNSEKLKSILNGGLFALLCLCRGGEGEPGGNTKER